MITQKAFIEKHKEYLDKEFVKKCPDGQFVIQRRCSLSREFYVNIYVNFRRGTSHTRPLWPSAFGIEHSNEDSFYFIRSQNNSFGKITIYKTLPKFLAACKKYFIKKKAIEEFLFFYNNKNIPDFVKKVQKNIHFCNKKCEFTVPNKNSLVWKI